MIIFDVNSLQWTRKPLDFCIEDGRIEREPTTISEMIMPLCCRWKRMRSSFLSL